MGQLSIDIRRNNNIIRLGDKIRTEVSKSWEGKKLMYISHYLNNIHLKYKLTSKYRVESGFFLIVLLPVSIRWLKIFLNNFYFDFIANEDRLLCKLKPLKLFSLSLFVLLTDFLVIFSR